MRRRHVDRIQMKTTPEAKTSHKSQDGSEPFLVIPTLLVVASLVVGTTTPTWSIPLRGKPGL
jgi:hypothetical protein